MKLVLCCYQNKTKTVPKKKKEEEGSKDQYLMNIAAKNCLEKTSKPKHYQHRKRVVHQDQVGFVLGTRSVYHLNENQYNTGCRYVDRSI